MEDRSIKRRLYHSHLQMCESENRLSSQGNRVLGILDSVFCCLGVDGHIEPRCLESLFGSSQHFTLEFFFFLLTLTRVSRLAPQASDGKSIPAKRGQSKKNNTHVLESIDESQLREQESPPKRLAQWGWDFEAVTGILRDRPSISKISPNVPWAGFCSKHMISKCLFRSHPCSFCERRCFQNETPPPLGHNQEGR